MPNVSNLAEKAKLVENFLLFYYQSNLARRLLIGVRRESCRVRLMIISIWKCLLRSGRS